MPTSSAPDGQRVVDAPTAFAGGGPSRLDAKGVAVSRPFIVGKGVRLPIPESAEGRALGFNDTDFTGNTGTLQVTVELPLQ